MSAVHPSIHHPPESSPVSSAFSTIARKAGKIYTVLFNSAEHTWSYIGKLSVLSRHVLNATIRTSPIIALTGQKFTADAAKAVNCIKLLGIIGLPFTLNSIKNTSLKIFEHIKNRDAEGLVLGTISLALLTGDAFDNITSFINTTLSLASLPTIGILSTIGLPLGLTMASVGTITRSLSIGKSIALHHQINSKIMNLEDPDMAINVLQELLQDKLGVSDKEIAKIVKKCKGDEVKASIKIERLMKRKRAALYRSASGEAAKEMEKLHAMLNIENKELNPNDLGDIFKGLQAIQGSLQKKIILDALSIFANVLTITALILFLSGVAAGPAPFILLAISVLIKIGVVVAEDINFTKVMETLMKQLQPFIEKVKNLVTN